MSPLPAWSDAQSTLQAIAILKDARMFDRPSAVGKRIVTNAIAHLERDLYCELTGRQK